MTAAPKGVATHVTVIAGQDHGPVLAQDLASLHLVHDQAEVFVDVRNGGRVLGRITAEAMTQVVDPGKRREQEVRIPERQFLDSPLADQVVGGVTASGTFVLAVKSRLLHEMPHTVAIIGSAGYDEVRFHEPLRGGDVVHVVMEWLEARASRSKPDRGVAKLRLSLVNQHDVTVMSHLDTIVVQRRP